MSTSDVKYLRRKLNEGVTIDINDEDAIIKYIEGVLDDIELSLNQGLDIEIYPDSYQPDEDSNQINIVVKKKYSSDEAIDLFLDALYNHPKWKDLVDELVKYAPQKKPVIDSGYDDVRITVFHSLI